MNLPIVKFSKLLELPGQTLLGIIACAGVAIERATLSQICKAIVAYEVFPKNIERAMDELLTKKLIISNDDGLSIANQALSAHLIHKLIVSENTGTFFKALDRHIPSVNLEWRKELSDDDRAWLAYSYRKLFILGEPSFSQFCRQHAPHLERYSNLWLGDLLYHSENESLFHFNPNHVHLALAFSLSEGSPSPEVICNTITSLWETCDQESRGHFYMRIHHVLRASARFDIMEGFLSQLEALQDGQLMDLGLIHLIYNRLDKAIECFEPCSLVRTDFGFRLKDELVFSDPWKLLYIFALLLRQESDDLIIVEHILRSETNRAVIGGYRALLALFQFVKGDTQRAKLTLLNRRYRISPQHLVSELLLTHAERTIIGHCPTSELHQQRIRFINRQRRSYGWWVNELEAMLVKPISSSHKKKPKQLTAPRHRKRSSSRNIRTIASVDMPIRPVDKTQQLQNELTRLEALLNCDTIDAEKSKQHQRFLWELNFDLDSNLLSVLPKVQYQEKSVWSSSQTIELSKLPLWCQHPQDRLAFQAIHLLEQKSEYWGNAEEFTTDTREVLPYLIGHPHLIDGETGAALDLKRQACTLIVKRFSDGLTIETKPRLAHSGDYALERQGSSTLLFSEISGAQKQFLSLLNLGSKLPLALSGAIDSLITKLKCHFNIEEVIYSRNPHESCNQ